MVSFFLKNVNLTFVVLQFTFILFHNLSSQIRHREIYLIAEKRAENNVPPGEGLLFCQGFVIFS